MRRRPTVATSLTVTSYRQILPSFVHGGQMGGSRDVSRRSPGSAVCPRRRTGDRLSRLGLTGSRWPRWSRRLRGLAW